MTAVNAGLTFLLVARVLPKFVAIFGRTLFVINIGVSVILGMLFGPVLGQITPAFVPSLDSIGYVIPALIAYDMNRQGVHRTVSTVAFTGALAAMPALVIVALFPGNIEPILPVDTALFSIDDFWFALGALISVGWATVLNTGHQLRCGGFIGAMYVGLMAGEPVALAFVLVMAVATWAFVQYGLKPIMIVFGRRKFAIVLMSGSLFSWLALELAGLFVPGGLGIQGLPVAMLFVPALLANDMERSSVPEVLVGTTMAGITTVSTILVVSGLVDGVAIPFWAVLGLIGGASVLIAPHLGHRFGWVTTLISNRRAPQIPVVVRGSV